MPHLASGLLGALGGALAWLATQGFVRGYRGRPHPWRGLLAPRVLRQTLGAAPLPPALAMAGLGALGAWASWRALPPLTIASLLAASAMLLAVTIIDLRVRRIPDPLSLALGLLGLTVATVEGRAPAAGLGLVVGGAIFALIALVGRGAMGVGDVKLATALGALLGYPLVLQGLFWGIIAGGVAALALLITRRAGRKDTMAYGPYLALGGWAVYLVSLGLLPWP